MRSLLLALCFMAGSAAHSQTVSGNSLASACSNLNDGDNVQAGYCIGYITGTWEGIKLGAFQMLMLSGATGSAAEMDEMTNSLLGICIPQEVETGQLVGIAIKSLEDNPASRHLPARSLLRDAFMEAFPCP